MYLRARCRLRGWLTALLLAEVAFSSDGLDLLAQGTGGLAGAGSSSVGAVSAVELGRGPVVQAGEAIPGLEAGVRYSISLPASTALPGVAESPGVAVEFEGPRITVRFDRDEYQITPDQPLVLGVLLDPAPEAGLVSYGVRVRFDPMALQSLPGAGVLVPPELDFDGVMGAGAARSTGAGWVGVKGTVDFLADPAAVYRGDRLFELTLVPGTVQPGVQYLLGLEFDNTLGSSEQIFVDSLGRVLDERVLFRGATVTIVPEPGPVSLLAVAGLVLWLGARARGGRLL